MRFRLHLSCTAKPAILPVNYQYPVSAAIYKIISRADEHYAAFLHDGGYGHLKSFKLFTFSDIKAAFTIKGDRMVLRDGSAEITICFHLPEAAAHFMAGLFSSQFIDIADRHSKAVFLVDKVVGDTVLLPENGKGIMQVMLKPISPVVAGVKNERGHYDYKSPEDSVFAECLIHNLASKYVACNQPLADIVTAPPITISIVPEATPPRSRLVTIKAGTPEETRVRGYYNFQILLSADVSVISLVLNSGLGLLNSQGFGCCEIKQPDPLRSS